MTAEEKAAKADPDTGRRIPVFLACDSEYLPFAVTTILSMLEHSERNFTVYIIHDGSFSRAEMKEAAAVLSVTGRCQLFFPCWKNIGNFTTWSKRFPPLVYVRLLLPEMYPQYDRALFLDADVLVERDIGELFDTDMGDRMIGAVPDPTWHVSYEKNVPLDKSFSGMGFGDYYRKHGFDPARKYYFAGGLLLDMKKLRKNHAGDIVREHACDNLLYQDQDILNLFMNDWICPLDPCWNNIRRLPGLEKDQVLHFVDKPWRNSSVGEEFGHYWRTLQKTPWFYRARAELLLYEIEASVNSLWRCPGDSAAKALLKLTVCFVCAFLRRIRKFL